MKKRQNPVQVKDSNKDKERDPELLGDDDDEKNIPTHPYESVAIKTDKEPLWMGIYNNKIVPVDPFKGFSPVPQWIVMNGFTKEGHPVTCEESIECDLFINGAKFLMMKKQPFPTLFENAEKFIKLNIGRLSETPQAVEHYGNPAFSDKVSTTTDENGKKNTFLEFKINKFIKYFTITGGSLTKDAKVEECTSVLALDHIRTRKYHRLGVRYQIRGSLNWYDEKNQRLVTQINASIKEVKIYFK